MGIQRWLVAVAELHVVKVGCGGGGALQAVIAFRRAMATPMALKTISNKGEENNIWVA